MIEILNWGLTPYAEAVSQQLVLVEEVARLRTTAVSAEKIVFCTHPPVVTIGRGTKPGDVHNWHGEIYEASRGGRATYHGPSQIVVYPIVDLTGRDLHVYMRTLEEAIVETLKKINIQGEVLTAKASEDGSPSLTGVWVREKKIASIGIAVKHGVAYHGLALNFSYDPTAYVGINPCGFRADVMTSIEEVLRDSTHFSRQKFSRETVQHFLQEGLISRLVKNLVKT